MPESLSSDMLKDVQEWALEECVELSLALLDEVLDDSGGSFGDRQVSRGDRILRFLDDAQTGALDILRVQSPAIFEAYVAEFKADVAQSPLVGGR